MCIIALPMTLTLSCAPDGQEKEPEVKKELSLPERNILHAAYMSESEEMIHQFIELKVEKVTEAETLPPAPPARYELTDEEREAIEEIVASEGGYCPYEFQALVAECILNGCEAEDMRPLEMFDRGDFWLTNDVEPTDVTRQVVSDVFDLGILPTDEPVRYYYNPKFCDSPAHESFCYVLTNCDCRFFKDWE